MSARLNAIGRWILAGLFVWVGLRHFTDPQPFVDIVPRALPAPLVLVHVSGASEILGGVGLMIPPLRWAAGRGLVVLLVCVLPANVNMAVNRIPFGGVCPPDWVLWGRLPLQLVLIMWVVAVSRAHPPAAPASHR